MLGIPRLDLTGTVQKVIVKKLYFLQLSFHYFDSRNPFADTLVLCLQKAFGSCFISLKTHEWAIVVPIAFYRGRLLVANLVLHFGRN